MVKPTIRPIDYPVVHPVAKIIPLGPSRLPPKIADDQDFQRCIDRLQIASKQLSPRKTIISLLELIRKDHIPLSQLELADRERRDFKHYCQTGEIRARFLAGLIRNHGLIKSTFSLMEPIHALFDQVFVAGRTCPESGMASGTCDVDKTVTKGETTNGIIWHAIQTRFPEIWRQVGLKGIVGKLIGAGYLMWLYKRGKLTPEKGPGSIGKLLDGLPILPVAREWAKSGAPLVIRQRVVDFVHRKTKELVRQEWEEKIARGEMQGPIDEAALEIVARQRLHFNSSQLQEVLEEIAYLLGVDRLNLSGSRAEYTPEGVFKTKGFGYNVKTGKGESEDNWIKRAGISKRDPHKTVAASDNPKNDSIQLESAAPGNRYIVVRDWRARWDVWWNNKNHIIDDPDQWTVVKVTVDEKGNVKKTLEEDLRFFPDTRARTPQEDKKRALCGVADMVPVAGLELLLHAQNLEASDVAAGLMIAAAGVLYGPLNRHRLGHFVVGTLATGLAGNFHDGGGRAFLGGGLLILTHMVASLYFNWNAKRIGLEATTNLTRGINLATRMVFTGGLWGGFMHYLNG